MYRKLGSKIFECVESLRNEHIFPMKIKKGDLPVELLSEIVRFIPFKFKWGNIRVSKLFDLFILKLQRKWIVRLKRVCLIEILKNKFLIYSVKI